jgi:hypothetical protein
MQQYYKILMEDNEKVKNFSRIEYGIQIVHRDKNAVYAAKIRHTNLIQYEKDLMYKHLLSPNLNYKNLSALKIDLN